MSRIPDAEVTGRVGRSASFEVTVNGRLIFSKLKTYGFPKQEDVLACLEEAQKGGIPAEITDAQSPGCCIS